MAIVWPCPLAVDAYPAAGRDLGFPRPGCPSCAGPLVSWPGYRRYVREAGRYWKIFVPRLRCGVSHALLPAFTLAWRLDMAETIGSVAGRWWPAGVRGGGARRRSGGGLPYATARGWVRGFGARAAELGVAFAAVAVELGGQAVTPPAGAGRFALTAIGAAFAAAASLPGWGRLGARVIEPASKLDFLRVLVEAGIEPRSRSTVRRRLPVLAAGQWRPGWLRPAHGMLAWARPA